VATEAEQQAVVALVYNSKADAETAAAQFPDRLLNATSLMRMEPFGEIAAERGMTSADVSVYPSTRDRYVVLVTLHSPLPGNTPDKNGNLVTSSMVYGMLARAYFVRDLAWLVPEF
jgi:hypothetical protein